MKNHFSKILSALFAIILLSSTSLNAQTNFSGKWVFDKTKSTPGQVSSDYPGTVTRQITQDAAKLSYNETYVQPGAQDWSTSDEIFNLDGKEQVKKDNTGTVKKTGKWSPDKRVLTLTYIDTQDGKDYLTAESLNLSADGKTLTIDTYSNNPVAGETKAKSIYHKK